MIGIEEVQTLSLSPTDIVVLKIDVGNFPKDKAEAYMKSVRESLKPHFDNHIIVMDSKCDIIKVTREQLQETN